MDDSSTEFIKKLKAELTCTVCKSRFDDPRVFPCLHTYCKKCVESLAQQKSSNADPEKPSSIVCPICNVPGPEEGAVGGLPKSPVFTNLAKLLDIYKAGESGSQLLTCENGRDSNPASVRCLDCDTYLCNICLELHKMQAYSTDHVTVMLDEIKVSGGKCLSRTSNCDQHKKELKIYCHTCAKLICDSCSTSEHHSSHEHGLVSEIQNETRKNLNNHLSSLQQLVGKAKTERDKAAALMEKHKTNVEVIHTKVDTTITRIIHLLKERQVEIHGEIDTEAKKEEDAISVDIKNAELILTRLTGSINFADRLVQSAGDSDLVSVARQTIDQCEKLKKLKIENKKTEVLEWDFDKADDHSADVKGLKVKVKLPLSHYQTEEK